LPPSSYPNLLGLLFLGLTLALASCFLAVFSFVAADESPTAYHHFDGQVQIFLNGERVAGKSTREEDLYKVWEGKDHDGNRIRFGIDLTSDDEEPKAKAKAPAALSPALPEPEPPSHPDHPCLTYSTRPIGGYWSYRFCPRESLLQYRSTSAKAGSPPTKAQLASAAAVGRFEPASSAGLREHFYAYGGGELCRPESGGAPVARSATVEYQCCALGAPDADPAILKVTEPRECEYEVVICHPKRDGCDGSRVKAPPPLPPPGAGKRREGKGKGRGGGGGKGKGEKFAMAAPPPGSDPSAHPHPPFPASRSSSSLSQLSSMFTHAYDAYHYNGSPSSSLKSLTCRPGTFHLSRLNALPTIDALDTLLVMGNHTEFARAVERLRVLDE
jgi:hypothetical protein